jgi:hypothetical protein
LEREDPVASRTWLILVVSDLPDGKIHGATLTQEPVNDRSWRWDRKTRAQGETNRVMSKHLAHKELLLPAYESQFTSWEKKNASHARRLLLRRRRWYISAKLRKKAPAHQVHQVPAALMLPKMRLKKRADCVAGRHSSQVLPNILNEHVCIILAFSFLGRIIVSPL